MIKIKDIKIQNFPLYDSNNNLIGNVNEYQFNDVRIQIGENNLSGYYLLFTNEEGQQTKINILPDSSVEQWPSGFFDLYPKQLSKILNLRFKNDKNSQ